MPILITIVIVILLIVFETKTANPMNVNEIYKSFKTSIDKYSAQYNVPVSIITGIIAEESSGDPNAIGSSNDRGLMQITPIALADVNNNFGTSLQVSQLFDPDTNIHAGTAEFSLLLKRTGNDTQKSLQSYNAGLETVTLDPTASAIYAASVLNFANELNTTA